MTWTTTKKRSGPKNVFSDRMAQLDECPVQSQLPTVSTDLPELPNCRELPLSSEAGSLNYQVN